MSPEKASVESVVVNICGVPDIELLKVETCGVVVSSGECVLWETVHVRVGSLGEDERVDLVTPGKVVG